VRLNSKAVGMIVLVVMFGGILLTTGLGWWQTEGGGRGAGNHDGAGSTMPEMVTLRGVVSAYDQRELAVTTDDGRSVVVELGSPRYNRSIGFAPQIGQPVTVEAFIPGSGTTYNAITILNDRTGIIHAFRDALGQPLWVGKNSN